ncbi:MAG TPA: hypothetical protein VH143_18660 [Kofleriaceae bacterium]|nr:hypothetical protein [Kofleriaceae bacterium]
MDVKPKKRSLFHRAFWNQYNMIMMGAAGVFALATFTWIPLVLGAGVEALWLVLGSDSSPFKRWVALQEGLEGKQQLKQDAEASLAALEPAYRSRFRDLLACSERVQALAKANPCLETRLIQGEMDKLGQLLHSFLQMAITHQRLGHYLADNDENDLRRDIEASERALRNEQDAQVLAGLRQGLALAQKRLKQHQQIEANYRALGVKMDTLDKSFRYLESHVVAISEQQQLAQEIDDLVVGVDAASDLDSDGGLADIEATLKQRQQQAARGAQQRVKN